MELKRRLLSAWAIPLALLAAACGDDQGPGTGGGGGGGNCERGNSPKCRE